MADYRISYPDGRQEQRSRRTPLSPEQLQQAKAAGMTIEPVAAPTKPRTRSTPVSRYLDEWKEGLPIAATAALGLIQPEMVPALAALRYPQLAAAVARILGSSSIGAGEAVMKGEHPGESAIKSGGWQAALEALAPTTIKVGLRAGSRVYDKLADRLASTLNDGAQRIVSWWSGLGKGHAGLDRLLSGEGREILSKEYGEAMGRVKGALPPEHMTGLAVEDANALGLNVTKMVTPTGGSEEMAYVPTDKLIDMVHGLWRKNLGVSRHVIEALDRSLPADLGAEFNETRRVYREGASFLGVLERGNVMNEPTGRLNPERLVNALRAMFPTKAGQPPARLLDTQASPLHAPQTFALFREAVPSSMKAPHVMGTLKPYITTWGHIGVGFPGEHETAKEVLTRAEPRLRTFTTGVPFTESERLAQRAAPSLIHAAGKSLAPEAIPEGVTP